MCYLGLDLINELYSHASQVDFSKIKSDLWTGIDCRKGGRKCFEPGGTLKKLVLLRKSFFVIVDFAARHLLVFLHFNSKDY